MAGAKASYCHLVQMVRMFMGLLSIGSAMLPGAELLESDCKTNDTAHRTGLGNSNGLLSPGGTRGVLGYLVTSRAQIVLCCRL